MPVQVRPKRVKTEAHMSQAVACHLRKYAAREVKVGDCIFNVVAYIKKERLFKIVDCKRSRKASGIGHAFGQVAAYSATIAERGRDFIVAYSKKLRVPMHEGRWMEAIDYDHRFRVAFYVALTEAACKRAELLGSLKKLLPDVGIIRVKPDGYCRDYMRLGKKKDDSLNKAKPVTIKILRNDERDSE